MEGVDIPAGPVCLQLMERLLLGYSKNEVANDNRAAASYSQAARPDKAKPETEYGDRRGKKCSDSRDHVMMLQIL